MSNPFSPPARERTSNEQQFRYQVRVAWFATTRLLGVYVLLCCLWLPYVGWDWGAGLFSPFVFMLGAGLVGGSALAIRWAYGEFVVDGIKGDLPIMWYVVACGAVASAVGLLLMLVAAWPA